MSDNSILFLIGCVVFTIGSFIAFYTRHHVSPWAALVIGSGTGCMAVSSVVTLFGYLLDAS